MPLLRYTGRMKPRMKNFTIEYYIHYMRRQSKHVQHLHALAFAGTVTAVIAGVILYADYGFWHETYRRQPETPVEPVSTKESFGDFLKEAKSKFGEIGNASANLLGGKETFTR